MWAGSGKDAVNWPDGVNRAKTRATLDKESMSVNGLRAMGRFNFPGFNDPFEH